MSGDAITRTSLITFSQKKDALLWLLNWFTGDHEERPEGAFDIVQLVQVLQCAGFHLEQFKSNSVESTNSISLQVTCGKSGISATMTCGSFISCNCSTIDEMNKLATNESLDQIKLAMITDVIKEFLFMFSQTDLNKNEKVGSQNWEADPNITPPRDSSTPNGGSNKDSAVKHNLKQIKRLATTTLELLESRKDATFSKGTNPPTVKRISGITPETPKPAEATAPSASTKLATPVPMLYKKISSKVDTFRTKSSPVANPVKQNVAKNAAEKSKIPNLALSRSTSVKKIDSLMKYKTSTTKK